MTTDLRSKDTIEVILGLCEGPIGGLRSNQDFFVGNTPLEATDGTSNFKAFTLKLFPGTPEPDPIISQLGGSANNTSVNVTLDTAVPVVRQTHSGAIDFIEFRIAFEALYVSGGSGPVATTVEYKIEYKDSSSSTWIVVTGANIKTTGRAMSLYIKEIRVPVARINVPYDLRVTKISPINTATTVRTLGWESFQEVVSDAPHYPNTACLQLVAEATDQFSSIPQWTGVYDLLLVKLPSNYNPATRVYTGIWDGTWQLAWSDNPAWALYDFVMNDRYGIRSYYPEINLDKYDIYDAGKWCDELVSDGKGGLQPRYTMNLFITSALQGKALARYMAGAFNATFFDNLNGTAFLRIDKDDPATHIFTKENVFESGFDYSYTDMETRYNDITVQFVNPDLKWNVDARRVFSQPLIDKNGRIPLDFVAVGCTNVHEAMRRGFYKLITANTETCLVSFQTNRLGSYVSPFDVILICDPDMGTGISGRVKSIDTTRTIITLRDQLYLEAGVPYKISLPLSDSTTFQTTLTGTTAGFNSRLFLAAALPEGTVVEKSVFTLEHATLLGMPQPFRVLKCEEGDGNPDLFNIQAININRNKWYDADNLIDTGVINYSVLPDPLNPPGPTSVTFTEIFVKSLLQFYLIIEPTFDRGAYKYYTNDHSFEVWSRLAGTTDPFIQRTVVFGDTVINHPSGTYEFAILGVSYLGGVSKIDSVSTYVYHVVSPKDPPADVDYLKINRQEVYWGYATPPDDFAGFELRYHNEPGVTTWDDAIQPHQGLLTHTSYYTNLIPDSARVIMVKAVDLFGIESVNARVIFRDSPALLTSNVFDEIDYDPAFAGTKTNCSVVGSPGVLTAADTGALLYIGIPTAPMYTGGSPSPLMYADSYLEMSYQDTFTVTVPGDFYVKVNTVGQGYDVQYKLHTDIVWVPMPAHTFLEAGLYDIKFTGYAGNIETQLINFAALIDVPDISEHMNNISISSAGTRLPISNTYTAITMVSVTIEDDGVHAPIGYRVFDKNPALGPLIKLYDAAGVVTDGLIDADIKGY